MKKIAFLGMGIMGYPMAGHLQKSGFDVTVYNRSVAKSKKWQEQYQGKVAQSPAQAACQADVVLTCLGNDQSVFDTLIGRADSAITTLKKGSIVVDHTTTSATLAKKLENKFLKHQVGFIDAPLSGGQQGSIDGELTIMCGGSIKVFEKLSHIFSCYGLQVEHFGPAGSGQIVKMANQICVSGVLLGLSEANGFLTRNGLDSHKVFKLLEHGAAGSWQMKNRGAWISKQKFNPNEGFPIEWMHKDLGFCLEQAQKIGYQLDIAKIADSNYQKLINQGDSRLDTACLSKEFL